MRGPLHLWTAWGPIRRCLRKAGRIALLVDFDGTLARITNLPEQARLPREVRELLAAISASGVLVGVVSGRSLDDIRARVGLPGIWYVGTHGFSLCSPAGRAVHLATVAQKERIAQVARSLNRRLRGLKGIQVERKDVSVAVHYRNASRQGMRQAKDAVEELQGQTARVRRLQGKKLWELLPDSRRSKWSAVQRILKQDPAWYRIRSRRRLVFHLGDDATDEVVFEHLPGISIVVGKRFHTSARYFLKSPAEVRLLLRSLLEEVA